MLTTIRLKVAVLCCALLGGVAAIASGQAVSSTPTALPSQDQNPAPDDEYVGADVCAACHQKKHAQFVKTPHWVLVTDPATKTSDRGCEACHGPGLKHVQAGGGLGSIFNPRKATAAEVAARCTACHQEQNLSRRPYHVEHDVEAVSCNDCHSPHQDKTNPYLLIDDPPKLCFQCHKEVESDFRKPFHHKVLEGGVSCRDCHSGHGENNTAEARRSADGFSSLCARCHADKQQPFVFEHLALNRSEDGCLTCHSPHGSVNNRMLNRATVFQLCMQCHSEIGLSKDFTRGVFPHDLADARFRECTVCHTQIHGSNSHRAFLN